MTNATLTGKRVLNALAEGRRRAIANSQADAEPVRRAVLQLAREDEARGRSARGRAGRIHEQLHLLDVSLRTVQRIIKRDTLSSLSHLSCDAPDALPTGAAE